ncbi:ROK family transcriptional regulator [Streptomyces acidiscabies]|uniref:ROK family transcriptional regulator n=1 Tax=Streptomyces acidiscabies TaxID=42234 RepID=A0AAP6B978_9ACTN|nr:ROK family transcriptional regulator [Streptomyces acidiscabies]MBP5936093.1 ROK family transcriptional regulator [Streptomyces sp. LBUM 1476]MDX2960368.1 ROK family transcriptional regulator [Streptomyces acidiscabies]MDX3023792.1 ROK family transcriptional regulator [Streptomyces acidiscabies]MDX3793961.1 ROK family transcriptional regulator [Streptomyces acidiscabies]
MKRTSRDIRTANRYEVLRQIIARSPTSRQELAAETGLSLATVATLVGELLDLGMITEVGFEDSAGGRPRGLVAVNARGGALIGVDIAETYVHVELYDLGLNVLARAQERMRPGQSRPEQVVAHIAAATGSVVAQAGVDAARVLGVGVSMPGQVDRATGVSEYAPNWDWHDVPLLDLLAEHIAYPLYLDNPLRACAVAELWFGAARGHGDAVVVILGTGVGAGLILGGAVHRGVSSSAGEWGHSTLVLDGRLCHCGNHGCVETYVGAPGIMQNIRELSPRSPLLHPEDQSATLDALAAGLAEQDPIAVKVVQDLARYLGAAIADLVNVLNPEVVVLGSWVALRLGEPLVREVREAVARHALKRPMAATEIVLSPILTDSVCLGAATLALEGALQSSKRTATARTRTAPPS